MRCFTPLIALFIGLGLGLGICVLAGENPVHILRILVNSSFGSSYDLGMTLFYATPLILTGLAVAIPFQAGLFNIGAEGQLAMGALFAVTSALIFPSMAWPLAPLMATGAAFLGGALWGAIPGYLKAKRGSHEVIVTIMLNFIAAGLISWVVLYVIKNPETQNPESLVVPSQFMLMHLDIFGKAPVSTALFYVLGVAMVLALVISRTVFGYELRAVGKNETASSFAGIEVDRMKILAMILGGGIAGLVGMVEILGHEGKLRLGFSQGAGFIGIAVALLARGNPLTIILASLLFGALQKGAMDLELETSKITRDLSVVIQALIILSMAVFNKVKNGTRG